MITQSIQRISWRFNDALKKQKGFIPNQADADALNELIDFYDNTKQQNATNNELAFKMYIWLRVEVMKKYETDIFDMIPQRVVAEALCKDRNSFLLRLTDYLNAQEVKAFTSKDPLFQKHPILMTELERNEATKKLKKMLEENPDLFDAVTDKNWSVEDVHDNILAEFNQLIQIA